ncbi:uncharacterized protein AC631_04102 [Debaryomyces fabryi]|uniref:HDA1 complex subunit 2 n=1 Tax=Debaryomyces fabryi TaxID=58627 RepID=A0A0V1PW00_9ASCO|nr:uncharacterized protein AC631_04102 [Debaryomyces fabryi]KSA00143.1 hypothetical protein AC631_04102 [Debaryomyces fabryi]CUM47821.1 unnamed protein product [Debaryomyces fabryi]
MNLMDMLSGEARDDIYQTSDMQLVLDENDPLTESTNIVITQPENGVYYLPSVLTQLQKDLMETVLHIFSLDLLDEIRTKRERSSINSLLDNTVPEFDAMNDTNNESMNKYDKVSLLFEQLRLITKHPSLLVDHFMPKKLLLLEVNERLASLSGKFQLFNRLLDSFIDNNSLNHKSINIGDKDFHILVVAESVKELELIEGLIIGKKLHYNNLSSEKLYNDNSGKQKFKREVDNIDDDSRRKRKHHSSATHTKKNGHSLCLSLATSQQLYNNYSGSFENLQINLIFSFDSNIDTQSPSMGLIRSNNLPNRPDTLLGSDSITLKTPIFIPILNFSIEHIILQMPQKKGNNNFNLNNNTTNSPIYKWKLQVLNSFAVNRREAYEDNDHDFFLENYGSNMSLLSEWFYKWDIMRFPFEDNNALTKFNDRLKLNFTDDQLARELQVNYLYKFGYFIEDLHKDDMEVDESVNKMKIDHEHYKLEVFNYKTFKSKFALLIYDRVCQIERAIDIKHKKVLPSLRLAESLRQSTIDEDEDAISNNYRKLRKLNDEANLADKKMSRAESDTEKFQEHKLQLEFKVQFLRNNLVDEIRAEEELVKTLSSQEKLIEELNKELENTTSEYERLCEENNAMSVKYQNSSADAVQLSSKLVVLKDANTKLEGKLNGAGIQLLPSLINKDELINHEVELNKLKKENEFILRFFDEKLDKLIKERTSLMESTSNGSSSRPTNRISRASTPF